MAGSPWSFGEDGACNLYVSAGTTVFRIVGSGGAGASICPVTSTAQQSCCQVGANGKKAKKCRKHKHKKKKRAAESKNKKKKHKKKCKKRKKHKKKR